MRAVVRRTPGKIVEDPASTEDPVPDRGCRITPGLGLSRGGVFIVDVKKSKMITASGHPLVSAKDGEFQIKSSRYPFCACVPAGQAAASYPVCQKDDPEQDNSIRSAMTLIPFNKELNRLM